MSKKYFQAAANEIARIKGGVSEECRERMAFLIIHIADNPNFDQKRFLKACLLEKYQ